MRRRFQFSLKALIWFASACAFAAAMSVAYRSVSQRSEHPLVASLLSLGLTSTVLGTLLSGWATSVRSIREKLAVALLTGFIVGIAVHCFVAYLLGTTGALVALVMREDNWTYPAIPGIAIRVAWGILSAIAITTVGRSRYLAR